VLSDILPCYAPEPFFGVPFAHQDPLLDLRPYGTDTDGDLPRAELSIGECDYTENGANGCETVNPVEFEGFYLGPVFLNTRASSCLFIEVKYNDETERVLDCDDVSDEGEEEESAEEIQELRETIEKAGMPEEALEQAKKELKRMERMQDASAEYSMLRTWIDWMIQLPWSKLEEYGYQFFLHGEVYLPASWPYASGSHTVSIEIIDGAGSNWIIEAASLHDVSLDRPRHVARSPQAWGCSFLHCRAECPFGE
jgi:hypothetical protein